jgi:hypothetical protein
MEESDHVSLRKRGSTPVIERTGRPRERSVEPGFRKRETAKKEVVDTLLNDWESFKETFGDKYPNIKFPDEYFDTDVVSASVAGIDANLKDVVGYMPENVTFNVQQDGRIVVEFKKQARVETSTPIKIKIGLPSKNTLILSSWLLCMVCVAIFIKLNVEKYKKLMWT